MKNHSLLPIVLIIFIVLIFFGPFLRSGKLPIPTDTIIGLYHPFRDLYAKEYSNGVPFKNFLITDPVRQQYPWRELSIEILKKWQLPLWNPYAFAGTPLLANFQIGIFYPLNIFFLFLPFYFAWSLLVFSQPLLGGIFIYLYLSNIRINKWASLFGAVVFSFCGFSIAWLEWNTIGHVVLWLPLILLATDKILKENIKHKKILTWGFVFVFSLASSLFAGHLQTFFYVFMLSILYFFTRWWQYGRNKGLLILFVICYLLFVILTMVQWVPTLQLIQESARGVDQANWQIEGWFIPWQHVIQFIAPDFFGNPATLNYWGVWNYAEFIGYAGILPLIFVLFGLFIRRDKKTLFFGTFFFLSLIFSFPTILAKLPYILDIPFLSTSQPTRLLFITNFSLAILAALGFDYFIKQINKREILYPIGFLAILFGILWGFVYAKDTVAQAVSLENLAVAKRNLILPTTIFIVSSIIIGAGIVFSKIGKIAIMIRIIIVMIVVFDLFRFGEKFTPFTNREYLFPITRTIEFLQKNTGYSRIMSVDSRILPPNFLIIYRLQGVEGYDPLYLKRYGELIAASERGKANISPPFRFNRIITPHRFDSKIVDLLGVKYILSLSDLSSPKLKKVFQEGQTRVYENINAFPRVFFVETGGRVLFKEQAITYLFKKDVDLKRNAVIEDPLTFHIKSLSVGKAEIVEYSENRVIIKTTNGGDGLLVLTDSFYPTWKATIDGQQVHIYRADYNFRGIFVPKGKHTVEFYNTLI